MDVLNGMRAFREVAAHGSFAAAARSLSVTTAWVSKLVAQLEEHLGARLLVRTTRRLALTEAGRLYLERCERVLGDLQEAESVVSDLHKAPRGKLRIAAPMSFGLLKLAPLFPQFAKRYPEVELDVVLSDRVVDLIEEGFDIAVRIAEKLQDSTLTVRKVGGGERIVVAAPRYLRKHGTPQHPSELSDHQCLRYALHREPSDWRFQGADGLCKVRVRGPLQVNNSIALREAAVSGLGIMLTPDFVVNEQLLNKQLTRVLPRFTPSSYGVFAVAPATRYATPKARAFIDYLVRALR